MAITSAGRFGGMVRKAAASRSDTETLGSSVTIAVALLLFALDLAGTSDGGPVRDLVGDVLPELRRRHRHHFECLRGERIAHLAGGENLVDLPVELLDDGLRQLRRSDDAVPGQRIEAFVARLLE